MNPIQYLKSLNWAHSYATEQNGIPDKYLLTVSVHKAYEQLKKFFHTLDGVVSEYFVSEDKFKEYLLSKDFVILDKYEKKESKPKDTAPTKAIADSLDVSHVNIDGDTINARNGFIKPLNGGMRISINADTSRKLTAIKKKFNFMSKASSSVVHTGVFELDRMPTVDEAAVIRTEIGLNKRRARTPVPAESAT